MGVRKFRSVEEMTGPPPRPPLEPENLRIAFGLMALSKGLGGGSRMPGVRRFRSHDEAVENRTRSGSLAVAPRLGE